MTSVRWGSVCQSRWACLDGTRRAPARRPNGARGRWQAEAASKGWPRQCVSRGKHAFGRCTLLWCWRPDSRAGVVEAGRRRRGLGNGAPNERARCQRHREGCSGGWLPCGPGWHTGLHVSGAVQLAGGLG
jgi:hypothetical protein